MFRKLFLIFCLLLIVGCSSTSKRIGGFENNMETGISVYHQYIITTASVDSKGKIVQAESLLKPDLKDNLPSNVVKLKVAILVINPYNVKFEVWENLQFTNLETGRVYLKHKDLRHVSQTLPEELVSVDLPLEIEKHSQVIFSVDILDESGKLLYSTYSAEYKIGSNNN